AVAPFFRIPGLLRQDSVERYLADHNYMTWSVDLVADDWTHIKSQEVARRAINRLEARGKGILLLHDIQPATAIALPDILKELKARGFKIVHVVPGSAIAVARSEEHTSELQSLTNLVCRLLPEKKRRNARLGL